MRGMSRKTAKIGRRRLHKERKAAPSIGVAPDRNRGVNWAKEEAEQSSEDYVFGAGQSVPSIALIPEADREKYLPVGEVQRGKDDFMDCATRSPMNSYETQFNFLYREGMMHPLNKKFLEDEGYVAWYTLSQLKKLKVSKATLDSFKKWDVDGRIPFIEFSDRFNAILSGTDKSGNSLKAPNQSIHADGLIPKRLLPASETMTFEDYHRKADITPDMLVLGARLLERFPLNYERVKDTDYANVVTTEMIGVAGYAWPKPDSKTGIYPKTDKGSNHAFMFFKTPRYHIFDNYFDKFDGDFIKRLADNYDLMGYGYRAYISGENVPSAPVEPVPVDPEAKKRSLMLELIAALTALVALLTAATKVGGLW